jgi:hypothetical protein
MPSHVLQGLFLSLAWPMEADGLATRGAALAAIAPVPARITIVTYASLTAYWMQLNLGLCT